VEINEEMFKEAIALEDMVQAFIHGYYDTHDLGSIEENIEEYTVRLEELRVLFGLTKEEYFCAFVFEDFEN
jgi:hypothetical protein